MKSQNLFVLILQKGRKYILTKAVNSVILKTNEMIDKEKRKAYDKAYNQAYYKANIEHARTYRQAYYRANIEHIKAYNKALHKANSERCNTQNKAWRQANPERVKTYARVWGRLHRYGLTVEAFESMLLGQGGVCAICGRNDWGKPGPCVDHAVGSTGEVMVRGILCLGCNLAIGGLKHNPEIIRAAADYLERNCGSGNQ